MNPLMMAMQGANSHANKIGQINSIIQMLKNGNPEQIAMRMMQSNPQFKAFMDANKGKDPMQVARENGIDLYQFLK